MGLVPAKIESIGNNETPPLFERRAEGRLCGYRVGSGIGETVANAGLLGPRRYEAPLKKDSLKLVGCRVLPDR